MFRFSTRRAEAREKSRSKNDFNILCTKKTNSQKKTNI